MRVVLVLIDGARTDVLRDLLKRGDLPHLARWVIEPGSLTTGTTVFPSTTGVAYIPFLFGRYPGSVGIPGIRWLDRRGAAGGWRAQWHAARSYCGVQGGLLNSDIAPAPSLFDLVPESIAICTPLTRGLGPNGNRIALRRAVLGSAAHYLGTYPALDRAVARAWLEAAAEPWRFLFVVFPGVDGISHLKDPLHPAVLESYRLVDRALGDFVARVRQRGDELPAFFVVSDHGMTVMRDHFDVAVQLERDGIRTIRHPTHVWRRGARAATMVSGNASVQVYFDPRSGRDRPLTESEIPGDMLDRFLALWEIPEHRAGHGSLIAEHMEVPIAASVALPELPLRTVDLMPTILERLDVAVPPGVTLDGVPFSKLAAVTDSL